LEKHKYTRFRVLLATTKFKQKFYRTAIDFNSIFYPKLLPNKGLLYLILFITMQSEGDKF